MAKLVGTTGCLEGKEYELKPGGILALGRSSDCEIIIADVPGVSRRHARFLEVGGAWTVEDLDSQNGVYLGKAKVASHALVHGDVLSFSQISLRFDAPETAPSPPASPPSPSATAATGPAPEAPVEAEEFARLRDKFAAVETQFGRVIVGQKPVLEQLLIALLAGGHCLMIGLPGLAKTLMVHTLADILELAFKRIQFTPDLMPSDIIGSDVLEVDDDTGRKIFRFLRGPVFTNMLLADEINRTPPKTQAALLEAMQERHVSISNQRFPLPDPFFVLATQNPLEQEGTYPLPEAQLDRFMFNILVEYPEEEEEERIVAATTGQQQTQAEKVLSGAELLELQQLTRRLPVSPHVIRYATRLTRATRPATPGAPDCIRHNVACGAGPRAAQFLVLGAKARAVLHGRLNVGCDDVRSLARPVLRHRIFTNFAADSEGVRPDDLIKRLLISVDEPGPEEY